MSSPDRETPLGAEEPRNQVSELHAAESRRAEVGGSESGPSATSTRGWVVRIVLLLAAVVQLSRIVQVESAGGEVPFLSANDRSRWCTIAALAVTGSYAIDDVLEIRDPKTRRRTWYTIDLVRHRGADGRQHYYSSKPPLLPTLYTGAYMALRRVTGLSLMNDPFPVARAMLVLVNLLPLAAFWWLMVRWIERELTSDWSVIVAGMFLVWGTFLSTFVITLNNHLPAAIAVGVSLWCVDRIAMRGQRQLKWFALCGLATSFAAANELPALSWVAAMAGVLLLIDPRRMLLGYLPGLLPVAIAFFAANYAAHGEVIPPYAHRGLGDRLFEFHAAADRPMDELDIDELRERLAENGIAMSPQAAIRAARRPGVFELWDAESEQRVGLQRDGPSDDGQSRIGVYEWGDWYDYPGSYWTSERKQGVDKGEPSRAVYATHVLVGHHGIFSLTPFWCLSCVGACLILIDRLSRKQSPRFGDSTVSSSPVSRNALASGSPVPSSSPVSRNALASGSPESPIPLWRDPRLLLMAAIVAVSVVAIGFYLARGLEDRNYGGVTSGFRWAFWLTPAWLWLAFPALRAVRAAWARRAVECLVLASVFSASFPWANPWTHPWPMRLWWP